MASMGEGGKLMNKEYDIYNLKGKYLFFCQLKMSLTCYIRTGMYMYRLIDEILSCKNEDLVVWFIKIGRKEIASYLVW